ncbi:MAG: DMT family transporter [Ktedonobacteraceae bacterium]
MLNGRKRRPSQRLTGYLMVTTSALLFGLNGNLSRLLFDDRVTPVTLVEFRMLIGGACLLALLLLRQRAGLKLPRRHWGWIVAFGLVLAMVTYTYFVAISLLPIAVALVIQFSSPAWMVLGEALWRRKLPSIYILMAVALTFGGIVLLTGIWQQHLNGLNSLGLLYAGLSIVAFIGYLILGRRVGRDLPSLTSTTYGAFVAAAFWLIVQPPWAIPASTWTPQHLFLIALVGIIGMAIPFSLVLGSLRRLDATRVGIASMLELVAGGAIAYFWLGQHLNLWQILGCVLVLAGITILQYEEAAGKKGDLTQRG